MRLRITGLVGGIAAVLAAAAGGAEGTVQKEETVKEGQLVCVGCHLEKEHQAQAQCTLYGKHAQGLLAADGSVWTLLDNARGHCLVTDRKLAGKPIRIHGWGFPKTQILEVRTFELKKGDRWVGYDYCKNCGFEEGDNHGKDLCGGCLGDGSCDDGKK